MRRKAFVFTLDALLSMVLVAMFITSILAVQTTTPQRVYSTYLRSKNTYTAQDVLILLKTVPLNEIVPLEKIKEWTSGQNPILNGTLVDPTMPPLDIISTYWAVAPIYPEANLTKKAEIILGYILNNTLEGYNYELIINNYTSPYLSKTGSNYELADDVSAATITLSGRAYNKTAEGYMARLYLTQITKQDEYIYMSDAVLGYPYYDHSTHLEVFFIDLGWLPIFEQDNVRISYKFNLPSGVKERATLFFMPSRYVEFNLGGLVSLQPGKITISLNDNGLVCNGKSYSNYQLDKSERYIKIFDDSTNDGSYCNLLESLNGGGSNLVYNEITQYTLSLLFEIFNFDVPWLAIGDSGSSYLIYVYNTTKFKTYEFVHDFNFPDVQTENPTQIEKAIFIPHNITGMNVRMHINVPSTTTNVTLRVRVLDKVIDVGTRTISGDVNLTWGDAEIRDALNSAGLTYDDLTNRYFYVILSIGLKDYEEVVSPYEYGVLYDDEPTFLAKKFPHIDGGFHLIGDDSVVHVDYETPSYTIHTISLTRSPEVSYYSGDSGDGEFYSHVEWTWDLPNATPLYTKFLFPYFWNKVESSDPSQMVSLKNEVVGEEVLYCHGSACKPNRGLLKVFDRWGYGIWTRANDGSTVSPTMVPGENKFALDFGQGFYVSKDNSIGETLILLDSYIPYGDTFPYLLIGYPEYTGYNLTYYYVDIDETVKPDYLLIGTAFVETQKYLKIDIDEIVANRTYEKYAVDDAIVRLFKKLGGKEIDGHQLVIPIRLDSTVSDVVPLQRVPALYRPIKITLRIWREG